MRSIRSILPAVLLVMVAVLPAAAADHLQDALKMILKQNTSSGKEKAVWVSKNPAIVLPTSSPIAVGATLRVIGTNQDVTVNLPAGAANWKTNGAGTLYKFVNKLAPGGPSPCKVALIKSPTVFKVVCKDSIIALDDATQGTVSMVFTVDTDRYCSTCTGAAVIKKDEPGKFIAKLCPAPGVCPGGATTTTTTTAPTTTSTTTTTAGPTTTTTTTMPTLCCALPGPFCFDTNTAMGATTCTDEGGTISAGPACNGMTGACTGDATPIVCCQCPDLCAEGDATITGMGSACPVGCTLSAGSCGLSGVCGSPSGAFLD